MARPDSYYWKRLAALLYLVTVGFVVGIVVAIVGTLYGLVGTVLRVAEVGEGPNHDTWTRRPIRGPVSDTIEWWVELLYFALWGRATFRLTPDIS